MWSPLLRGFPHGAPIFKSVNDSSTTQIQKKASKKQKDKIFKITYFKSTFNVYHLLKFRKRSFIYIIYQSVDNSYSKFPFFKFPFKDVC